MLSFCKLRKSLIIIILSLTSFFIFFGCGGQEKTEEEQFEKIPPQLEEIETSIEQIFQLLDGPSKLEDINKSEEEKEKMKQGAQEGDQEKDQGENQESDQANNKDQEQDDEQEQNKEQGQDKEKDKEQENPEQGKPDQAEDLWIQVAKEIKNLHTQWNNYMPELAKKNLDKKMIDDFGSSLNNLTEINDNKNRINSLLAANKLYSHIPSLYAQYKTKMPPEVKRLIYYTRSSILDSMTNNWTEAESDMNHLKSSWDIFKNTLNNEQEDDSNKINLSIYELEKVINGKNPELVDLKGRITLSNVKEIEEKLKESDEQ